MKWINDGIKARDLPKQAARQTDKQLNRVCANWVNCSTEWKIEPITDLVIVHSIYLPCNFATRIFCVFVLSQNLQVHVGLDVQLIFKSITVFHALVFWGFSECFVSN